jgi:hypothetical protein
MNNGKSFTPSGLNSFIPTVLVNDSRTNTVHDRLYEKSKSPPLKHLKDLPSPLLRYSEKKILQARKEMECSFKPQISQRSSEIVDQMRIRTKSQEQPSSSEGGQQRRYGSNDNGMQHFDENPLYVSRDNKFSLIKKKRQGRPK